jgi:hypothetical protein
LGWTEKEIKTGKMDLLPGFPVMIIHINQEKIMDREEIRQRLRKLLDQRPFQPFRLWVEEGDPVDVRYPRLNLLGMAHITVGIVTRKTADPDPLYDHSATVLFKEIKKIEPLPLPNAPVS